MKIKLVFDTWRKDGWNIYYTEEGIRLSSGDFHSGTTFDGTIILGKGKHNDELKQALKDGYTPVFWVIN